MKDAALGFLIGMLFAMGVVTHNMTYLQIGDHDRLCLKRAPDEIGGKVQP